MEKCPYCRGRNIVFRGYRKNKATEKRLRLCKSCGKKFTPDDGFLRMRFRKNDIMKAVSLYKKGFSSSEVARAMRKHGVKVSRWTIICWYRKYG